jgi:hypothetical protein
MGGKLDNIGQNESDESIDDDGFEAEAGAPTTMEEVQAGLKQRIEESDKKLGANVSKLETVETEKSKLKKDAESVEEMGASDNEAMEEIEEKRDETEMGPEEDIKNWEEEFEKMVSGENIMEDAESRLSGDASELCESSTNHMSGGEKELVGKNFYEWVKHLAPVKDQFLRDLRGRLKSGETMQEAEEASKEAAQKRVSDLENRAEGSIAGTVNKLLNDMNSSPPPTTQVEELWEENRESAQAAFDKNMPQGATAAEEKWFDLMHEKYQTELDSGRTMEAMPEKGNEDMQQLQNELDEQGVDLDDLIKRSKAMNLLRYATDSKYSSGDKLNVRLSGLDGKELLDVDSLVEAEEVGALDMALKPKGELSVEEVAQCINETSGLLGASVVGGEVKFDSKISIDQGKKAFKAMQRKRLIKRNSKG